MNNTAVKAKITSLVQGYIETFPEEFEFFKMQMAEQRKLQKDQFASIGKDRFVERHLFELPETLFSTLQLLLDEEGKKFLWNNKDPRGARWFAKKFPVFTLAEKI